MGGGNKSTQSRDIDLVKKYWIEEISKELRASAKHRHELFFAMLEEGYVWREALNRMVKLIGVNEYAEMIGDMKASNLINQLKPESNMTIATLEKMTKPLGVKMTFVPKTKKIG